MKVHLKMMGCRLNQSEIDTMARQLTQQGHELVDDPAQAEQVIFNTCAVTNDAARGARHFIRSTQRANPNALINVTGCYAQIAPDDIKALPGVARVVDNAQKMTIVGQITGQHSDPDAAYDLEPAQRDAANRNGMRTRAFIKVQDGCDNECTFCVTTIARGQGQSRDADAIINEINGLHSAGYQEAVLTGVHLGSYGHDLGDPNGLLHLTQRILAETSIPRVRLSSLEPWDIAPGFFQLWQHERLCPHLHLPLQSGCDATLRRMRRNTKQSAFRELVQAARAAIPDLRITSDVIVGFPGETDDEFAISEAFIHEMQFAGLHVFPYSVRPGTPASRMKGHLPKQVKKARVQRLLVHANAAERAFAAQYIGQTLPVLWEQVAAANEDGYINVGYTHNYIRVQATHPRPLTNLITPAQIDALQGGVAQVTPQLA
jgi:threonylcarbamoyladenosine tRNA methylthiotransferase MtaB